MTWVPAPPRTVAIVGAGTMGAGLVELAARAGVAVRRRAQLDLSISFAG